MKQHLSEHVQFSLQWVTEVSVSVSPEPSAVNDKQQIKTLQTEPLCCVIVTLPAVWPGRKSGSDNDVIAVCRSSWSHCFHLWLANAPFLTVLFISVRFVPRRGESSDWVPWVVWMSAMLYCVFRRLLNWRQQ